MEKQFEEAKKKVESFTKRPNDDELLHLYSLFKQVTVGDINIPQPGFFAIKEKAKWNAWNEKKGISKSVAMQSYIDFVNQISKKYT